VKDESKAVTKTNDRRFKHRGGEEERRRGGEEEGEKGMESEGMNE
jgi:hypothetical protein